MSEAVVRKWRRPKFWVPIALIVLFVIGGVAMRLASTSAANSVELDAWYKAVPMDDNAALAIIQASSHLVAPAAGKDPNGNSMDDFVTRGALTPKLAGAIEDYVRANTVVVEKLEDAVQLTGSRYQIDLSQGPEIRLYHLAPVKNLAFLMKWAVVQSSLEGKPEDAVRHLKTGFAIADSLSAEPLLISELVRIACVSILLPAVERLVNDHQITFEQASELDDVLRKTEDNGAQGIFRSMVGERAIGADNFDLTYKEFEQFSSWTGAPVGLNPVNDYLKAFLFNFGRLSGLNQRDRAFFLDTMTAWIRATQLDYPEMLRESKRVDDQLQAELAKNQTRHLISKMLLPQLSGVAKKEAFLSARVRCARMALAIEKYRSRNSGKLPTLADLQPDYLQGVSRDPVGDRPLEYRLQDPRGYIVLAPAATAMANEGRTKTNAFAAAFVVDR